MVEAVWWVVSRTRGRTDDPAAMVGGLVGCLFFLGIVVWLVVTTLFGDPPEARKPEPEPTAPPLKRAIVYVAGSEGGAYAVSWEFGSYDIPHPYVVAKGNARGIIGAEPKQYRLGIPESDQDLHFLDVQVRKTEDWEGTLEIVLQANDKIVMCDQTSEVEARDAFGDLSATADVSFDIDHPSFWKADWFCKWDL